jgi:hypothetical protein
VGVRYLEFNIKIHGIDAEDDAVVGFLKRWLRSAAYAGVMGSMRDYFNYRDEFESDIEVEPLCQAGEFSVTNEDSVLCEEKSYARGTIEREAAICLDGEDVAGNEIVTFLAVVVTKSATGELSANVINVCDEGMGVAGNCSRANAAN